MLINKPLKKMPYAQATVRRYDDGSVALISYKTVVATIDKEGWVRLYGLYSRTTIRHISAFASECGSDYYSLKKCYTDNLTYNIKTKMYVSLTTGEII